MQFTIPRLAGHRLRVLLFYLATYAMACPTLDASPYPLKSNIGWWGSAENSYSNDGTSHLTLVDIWYGASGTHA